MLSFTSATHHEAHEFLVREAELLDERRFREWLDLLAPDIVYRMPVRVTAPETLEQGLLEDMAHFDEDLYSLRKRIERFETGHAWTEDPPSRTRHFVTNVRTFEGPAADEIVVKSYVLLFRSRGDIRDADLVSAERTDVLRRTDAGLRLARREILADESVLRTQNLAVFL
jgi:3-phenylpropionate/cinnamic acid dioxygenase small subunit